jgi:hypothetical protein
LVGSLLSCIAGAHHARAQSQSCAGEPVPADSVRCPDGSIPSFSFDAVPTAAAPDGSAAPPKPAASTFPKGSVFGVWHTDLPGTPYASAIDVPGYYMLNVRPGIAPGDLTIDPNGAYAWNSIRGTAGHWMKNPRRPEVLAVLVDSVLGKQWTITLVDDHIKIQNGSTVYIGRR